MMHPSGTLAWRLTFRNCILQLAREEVIDVSLAPLVVAKKRKGAFETIADHWKL